MKGLHAMILGKSALLELTEALGSADGGQLMRRLLHTILQALIDAETARHIGADPHERTDARTTYQASIMGRYRRSVEDLQTPYVYPQENGNRPGVR
jgi:transposase-like protein